LLVVDYHCSGLWSSSNPCEERENEHWRFGQT
jgi:hypothetical protein